MVVQEGFKNILKRKREEGEADFKREEIEVALLKTCLALDGYKSQQLKDALNDEQIHLLNNTMSGDRQAYDVLRNSISDNKRTKSLLEQVLDSDNLDLKNGGYKNFIVPKEDLGNNVMLALRGKTNYEMIHILTDMIIMRINGGNDCPMDVKALLKSPHQYYLPHEEAIQDAAINTLLEIGLRIPAEEFLACRSIKGLKREGKLNAHQMPYYGFPSKKFREDLDKIYTSNGWDSIEAINELVRKGQPFIDMVHFFNERAIKQNEDLVEQFLAKEGIRAVIIAGPSSSGKSTTTKKLKMGSGRNFKSLTVDMYFKPEQPKNPHGDTLYEYPESLDLNLLGPHLQQLRDGKEIITPKYDFASKKRYDGPSLKLEKGEVLLIDSHAGLFPTIRESFPEEERFIVYTQPQPRIKYGDGSSGMFIPGSIDNAGRRILRDAKTRGTHPSFNVPHWRTAVLGSKRDIEPWMGCADKVIDTGSAYDFHYLAAAYQYFEEFNNLSTDKFIEDGHLYAALLLNNLNKIFDSVEKPAPYYHRRSILPNDAVIREFIGGSDLNIE